MIARKLLALKSAPTPAEISPRSDILTLDNPKAWLYPSAEEAVTVTEAMKLSAVYRAIDYLCDFVASVPIYLYDRDIRKRVPKHPLMRMLTLRPNEMQTPSDYKRMCTNHWQNRGNSYAYIYRSAQSGRPVELIPLDPDCVRVGFPDGHLAYFYTHPTSGTVYRLDRNDVLHYKSNSRNGITGESPLKYAARTLRVAAGASEYEAAVYRNGAYPSGVLQTDTDLSGLSSIPDPDNPERFLTKKENIRRAWEAVYGGSANAFRTAVLDLGLKYEPLKISSYDAQFISAKSLTIQDIARFYGVPEHALMSGDQSYESNEQNALEFIQGKGLAMVRTMEEEDSYKLLLDSDLAQNYWVKRNLDSRLRGDTAARAAFYKTMREVGAFSANDICALEDQPDVPGGDVRYASLNYAPLDKFTELSLARTKTERPPASS